MKPLLSLLTITNVFLSLVIFLFVLFELYGVNRDLNMNMGEGEKEGFKESGSRIETASQKAPKLDNALQMSPGSEGSEGRAEREEGGTGFNMNGPKKASGPTETVKVIDPLKYEFSGYQNGYFRLGTFLFQWGRGPEFFSKNFDVIFGGMATLNTNVEKLKKNPKIEFMQNSSARIHNAETPCYWCIWGYKASEDREIF